MHFAKRNAGLFSDGCRTLTFPSFLFFANKRLVNHKIKTLQVPDMGGCELLCYHEPNCVSINFNADGPHAVSCDLNDATHRKHDNEFKDTPGYFYRGTEVNSSISSSSSSSSFFFFFLVSFFDFLLVFLVKSSKLFFPSEIRQQEECARAREVACHGIHDARARKRLPCLSRVFSRDYPVLAFCISAEVPWKRVPTVIHVLSPQRILSLFSKTVLAIMKAFQTCATISWLIPVYFFLTECLRNKPLQERWHLSIRFHRQRISLFVPPWLAVCTLSSR